MKNTDEDTLPDPELNPLLNPVLGAHMGRWAEVYFTSAPEKRTEAVAELLRQLRNEKGLATSADPEPIRKVNAEVEQGDTRRIEEEWSGRGEFGELSQGGSQTVQQTPVLQASRRCTVCGHESEANERFCGMCGTALQASPDPILHHTQLHELQKQKYFVEYGGDELAEISQRERREPEGFEESEVTEDDSPASVPQIFSSRKSDDLRLRDVREQSFETDTLPNQLEPARHDQTLEPSRQFSDRDIPSFASAPTTSVPYRYRLYVGSALALLLGVLLYMAWRGTTTFSGGALSAPSRAIPSAPPSSAPVADAAHAPTSVPAPAKVPEAPKSAEVENEAPRNIVPEVKPSIPTRAESSRTAPPRADRIAKAPPVPVKPQRAPIARPAARLDPVETAPAETANGQTGAEELAAAEKYLNGGAGTARDGSEAAQWLWKAVAKGNLAATLTLSDLYLRGDGVAKNCDQARLLLDAAAKRGGKAAAERLRNLPAFGCQ